MSVFDKLLELHIKEQQKEQQLYMNNIKTPKKKKRKKNILCHKKKSIKTIGSMKEYTIKKKITKECNKLKKKIKIQNDIISSNDRKYKQNISNLKKKLNESEYYNNEETYNDNINEKDHSFLPNEITDDNKLILMQLAQYIPLRKIKETINICKQFNYDFKCPSASQLCKLIQTKKNNLNDLVISYETTYGEWNSNELTFGSDGSSAKGYKYHGSALIKKQNQNDKFERLVLWQKPIVATDAKTITKMLNEEFLKINKINKDLPNILGDTEIKQETIDDSDDDVVDDSLNEMFFKLQNKIKLSMIDGSNTEKLVQQNIFQQKTAIFKCLTHGGCDIFSGIKESLKTIRVTHKDSEQFTIFKAGALVAIDNIIKVFNSKYEYNKKLSLLAFFKEKNIQTNIINKLQKYPKTREKDLMKFIFEILKVIKWIKQYIEEKEALFYIDSNDNENINVKYIKNIKNIVKCFNVKLELLIYIIFKKSFFDDFETNVNQKTNLHKAGTFYLIAIGKLIHYSSFNFDLSCLAISMSLGIKKLGSDKEMLIQSNDKNERLTNNHLYEKYQQICWIIIILIAFIPKIWPSLGKKRRRSTHRSSNVFELVCQMIKEKQSNKYQLLFKNDELYNAEKELCGVIGIKNYVKMLFLSKHYINFCFPFILKRARDKYNCLIHNKTLIFNEKYSISKPCTNDMVEGKSISIFI